MGIAEDVNSNLNRLVSSFGYLQSTINESILTENMVFEDYEDIPIKEIYRYISNAPIDSIDDLNPPEDLPVVGNDIASKLIAVNELKKKVKETIEGFYDGAITIPLAFGFYWTYMGIDTLTLASDKTVIAPDEKATLNCKLTTNRIYGGVENIPVKLTKNGAVMGTYTTDSNGEFTVEYTPENAGEDVFVARLGNAKSSPVALTVQEPVYNLTLSSDKTECMVGDTVTLTATLTSDIGSVADKEIVFNIGGSQYSTITNNEGASSYTYTPSSSESLSIYSQFDNVNSDPITITAYKIIYPSEASFTSNISTSQSQLVAPSLIFDNTENWTFTADVKTTSKAARIDIVPPEKERSFHIGIGINGSNCVSGYIGTTGGSEINYPTCSISFQHDTYYPIKIVKTSKNIEVYFNNMFICSKNEDWLDNYAEESIKFTTWGITTIFIKNIKVV